MAPRLVYIVTEDWYFAGHRLPMARAAQDAGFEVHVITRVKAHRSVIESLGFVLHPIAWSRRSTSFVDTFRSIHELRHLLREVDPAIVHNVALKPSVLGSIACLGLPVRGIVNSINGLGSSFLAKGLRAQMLKRGLGVTLPILLNRTSVTTIVQNPDDRQALKTLGVDEARIILIPGSGVDTDSLIPVAEPASPGIRVGFVGRMLEDKGVRPLVEALRILRREGLQIVLTLAGTPDPENPTTVTEGELRAWSSEPGITWAGQVTDIGAFWAGNHIAVLPSRREGLPKSLLEAASCGRPMVATDAPGCREVVIEGETGLLVPIDDPTALAGAIRKLAEDRELRVRLGEQARKLAQQRFSSTRIGQQAAQLYREMAAGARL